MLGDASLESPASVSSALSARYELVTSPFEEAASDGAVGKAESAGQFSGGYDDIYGTPDCNGTAPVRSTRSAGACPPALQPVRRGSLPPQPTPSLGGGTPDQVDRMPSSYSNNATVNSSALCERSKSLTSGGSRLSAVDSKSERHRRYAQAVQAPLPDSNNSSSGSPAPALRTAQQLSGHSGSTHPAEVASARVESRRSSLRPAAPATTNILASSARRPSSVRLLPLQAALSPERDGAAVAGGGDATPDEHRAVHRPAQPVSSAPTYLSGGTGGSRGVVRGGSFLREPLHARTLSTGHVLGKQGDGASQAQGADPAGPTSRQSQQGVDASQRPPLSLTGILTNKEARREGREGSSASPLLTGSHSARAGASRSDSGGSSTIHPLGARNKNVDNFAYGLSALGFPVESAKQGRTTVATPGTAGAAARHGGPDSFLVAAVQHHATGSGGSEAATSATHVTLPSLMLQKLSQRSGSPVPGTPSSLSRSSVLGPLQQAAVMPPLPTRTGEPAGAASLPDTPKRPPSQQRRSSGSVATPLPAEAAAGTAHDATAATPPPPQRTVTPSSLRASGLKSKEPSAVTAGSESRSMHSLEETRAGLGNGFDDSAPTVCPSSSNGSSGGALGSVVLRSTVLQPRRLPHHLYDVYGFARESSNDFFLAPPRSTTATATVTTSTTYSGRVSGSGVGTSQGHGSPTLRSVTSSLPRSGHGEPGAVGTDGDWAAARVAAGLLVDDLGYDDPLLFTDSDGSYSSHDDSAEEDDEREAEAAGEGGRALSSSTSTRHTTRTGSDRSLAAHAPGLCAAKSASRGSASSSGESALDGRRRGAAWPAGGASPEERQLGRRSTETFLPFDEGTAVGSRGFGSLLLTSFLRHAGSSEAVWTPPLLGPTSSSPPPSLSATVTGLHESSQFGSLPSPLKRTASLSSAEAATATGASASTPQSHTAADGPAGGLGGRTAAAVGGALRVPVPPQLPSRPHTTRDGTVHAAPPSPAAQGGILRWAKPLSATPLRAGEGGAAAAAAEDAAAASPQRTGERLLRQLALSSHGAWQDAQCLSIIEHATTPSPAPRVFAVDDGYTIRVVQNNMIGDCETDECVEYRPASATASGPLGGDVSGSPPSLSLPSVLVDDAVRRFVEEGENAIAMVMDTAADFAAARDAQPTAGAAAKEARVVPSTAEPSGGDTRAGMAVVHDVCCKVLAAFAAFKEAQRASQPTLVADLKVAVALVPVSESGGVFYDVVGRASSEQDSRRRLEMATSPIFGTCLNGCQWLVVEDASDISAVFALLRDAAAQVRGQQGLVYIQFLHQCLVPGTADAADGSGSAAAEAAPSRGVAGFARRRNIAAAQATNAERSTRLGDIIVSSFSIVASRSPQVFEELLDQRAGTPWPLLRFALGKGPSTVLGVVRVHQCDEEAAHPLSVLQRMRAMQHPRPRRGSVRAFVAEQRTKVANLRRRLAEAEERAGRMAGGGAAAAASPMAARLAVLVSKVECSVRDAEDFLRDPESAHVPVYVEAHRSLSGASRPHSAGPPLPGEATAAQRDAALCSPLLAEGGDDPRVPTSSEPVLLAMVQHYDAATSTVRAPVPADGKTTARWVVSPVQHAAPASANGAPPPPLGASGSNAAARTLTAWLTLSKSVAFAVHEVTAKGVGGGGSPLVSPQHPSPPPLCETWRRVCARFHAGLNAAVVVAQEAQEASCLWSLKASLELVHSVLRDLWTPNGHSAAAQQRSPRDIVSVVVSVYHVSGSVVADLLRESPTSRVVTGTAAAGPVGFTAGTLAVRPLTGAAVPLSVSSQAVASLEELERVLREAVDRLLTAQMAAAAASGRDGSPDSVTRQCLAAPGYTVVAVELTQRVPLRGSAAGVSSSAHSRGAATAPDVLVSSLAVVNLGGHYSLLKDAVTASAAEEAPSRTAGAERAPAAGSFAAALLARLAVRRRDLVVCAAALPARPTAASVYGLMTTLAEFQHDAARVPHTRCCAVPGSVHRFIEHLSACLHGPSVKDVAGVRAVLRRAQAVLHDPGRATFVSCACAHGDAALLALPAEAGGEEVVVLDSASAVCRSTSLIATTTTGTLASIGGSGSSPEMSTMPTGGEGDAAWTLPPVPHSAGARLAAEKTVYEGGSGAAAEGRPRYAASASHRAVFAQHESRVATGGVGTSDGQQGSSASPLTADAPRRGDTAYFGLRYRDRDPPLTQRGVDAFVARPAVSLGGLSSSTSAAAAAAGGRAVEAGEESDDGAEQEAVWMPSVLVLNAATTGSYVRRHGTRVRVPLIASTRAHFATYTADEVVNIKPTSMGMKSSLLTRAVSCVTRGRTAALLIADTESCDAASCMAWLTLRTVMGGIFQSLKVKEVEGVRHTATLRAFLVEAGREDGFADLLAPHLSDAQPRHLLTRLKYSPFCGPSPADATGRRVRDLQDVNAALGSVVAAARLVHPANTAEPLRGAVVLQLTVHQFVPATATTPADVVISSLWCVQMGCATDWMDAAPGSALSALQQFWLGGPCYTTSVVGLSRFVGVRTAAWRDLVTVQRRLREVPLRLPRHGSVTAYMAALRACLRGTTAAERPAPADGAATRPNSSSTSSTTSSPKKAGSGSVYSQGGSKGADSLTRVTALLREAQRMVERGLEGGTSSTLPGQLAHEAKTFAALD